jgi:hypothetical protein
MSDIGFDLMLMRIDLSTETQDVEAGYIPLMGVQQSRRTRFESGP